MLGDSHNFGRRVRRHGDRIDKPRTVFWERLFLDSGSPLRQRLRELASAEGLGEDAFAFLGHLDFEEAPDHRSGSVAAIALEPLDAAAPDLRPRLATVLGRSLAFWSWFGVADLHWENLALGRERDGRPVFAPLDVEIVLGDFELPTETKLLPAADPDVVDVSRHAAGVRRLLPFLGKPVAAPEVVAAVAAAWSTLTFLDRHSGAIGRLLTELPGLREAPIRVLLRGTDEYARAAAGSPVWPPLLDAEEEQLERGDVPYFFRLLGRPGLRWWADPELRTDRRLPSRGDVPQPDPLLDPARGLRSRSRRTLREEGLFAIVGALDHAGLAGRHRAGDVEIELDEERIVLRLPDGAELEAPRDLGDWVAGVLLPCSCGEVRSVLVEATTRCSAPVPLREANR